jgi:hypothetical protein
MWPFFMTTKLGLLALRGNNCILLYKATIKLLGMANEKGKQGRGFCLTLGKVRQLRVEVYNKIELSADIHAY